MIRPQIILAIATTAVIFTAVPAMARGPLKTDGVVVSASAQSHAERRV